MSVKIKQIAVEFVIYLQENFSWDSEDYHPDGTIDFTKKEDIEKLYDFFEKREKRKVLEQKVSVYTEELTLDPNSEYLKQRISDLLKEINEIK